MDRRSRPRPAILLVEDDPLTREQMADFLGGRYGRLSLAGNGEEGLALYRENRQDIVITDILMPVLDGLEMAREIRKLSASVPIVFMTAYNQFAHSFHTRQITPHSVSKPIDMDELVGIIDGCTHAIPGEEEHEAAGS